VCFLFFIGLFNYRVSFDITIVKLILQTAIIQKVFKCFNLIRNLRKMISTTTQEVTNNLFISFFTNDQILNEMLYPQVLDESFGVIASEEESDQEDLTELSDLYSSDSEEEEEEVSEFQTPPRPVTNFTVRLITFDETTARAEYLQELVNITTIRRRLFN
jgi:hypothetical protein